MPYLSDKVLRAYRADTFRLLPGALITNVEDALTFVEDRGFVNLWPIKGIDLPSLWTAVAGDRPVANEHDDPGHITWRWKDEMLSRRRWYYGKLLRGKATFVSMHVLPYFYALTERVAELDDYRLAYEAGHLSQEARVVADVLYTKGAQHTIQLRRMAHLSARSSKSRFNKALVDLQRGLWVLPVGVAHAGSWRYAFTYELLDRWLPEISQRARGIKMLEARAHLAKLYLDSVGASTPRAISRLFGWQTKEITSALSRLEEAGCAATLSDGRWATVKVLGNSL